MRERYASTVRRSARSQRRIRPIIEACEPRRLLTTYYVSTLGSNTADGLTPETPFQTTARVNALDLEPGDQVLFEGGKVFEANPVNLVLDPGFEDSSPLWSDIYDETVGNSFFSTDPNDLHTGAQAIRVDGDTTGGRGQVLTTRMYANTGYALELWGKRVTGSGAVYAGVSFFNGGIATQTFAVEVTSSSYQRYALDFFAPAQFDYVDVWFKVLPGTSAACFDDFKLTEKNSLYFDSLDSGTPENPVTIGSYGTNRAFIGTENEAGLFGNNVSGFVLRDLIFYGAWDGLTETGTNETDGLLFTNDLPANGRLAHLRVDNVDVSHYKWSGVAFRGTNGKAGFDDVRVTNVASHDNGDQGIGFDGIFDDSSLLYSHSNVYVGWCTAFNNGGLSGIGRHSGSGIILGDVNGATIERSIAWNNGQNSNHSGGGPIGIWAWDSNAVTIQYNESYGNKTDSTGLDGGGFNLDGGVTNSVMQYNYSHDNDGAGFLLYQFTGARPFGNNVVRYNVSENDARDNDYAGIYLGGGGAIDNNQIYNNTVFMSPSGDSGIAAIVIDGVGDNNVFRNNLIYVTGGVQLLDTDASYDTDELLFQGNNWYVASGSFDIDWGSSNVTSLGGFRNKGQEKLGTTNTGTTANPQLLNPGGGGIIGDAARLHLLFAYQRLGTSPVIDAGVNLSTLGTDAGPRDFFGFTPGFGAGYDIGAFETAPVVNGTQAGEQFIVRPGPDGSTELFIAPATSAPAAPAASAVPTLAWGPNVFAAFDINALGGDDTYGLDGIAPTPIDFDGGSGATTLAYLSGSRTHDQIDPTPDLSLYVAAGASLHIAVPQPINALTVAGNATLPAGGLLTLLVRSIDVTGQLDLADNDLVIDYDDGPAGSPLGTWDGSAYSGITGMLRGGRIIASAAAGTGGVLDLGVAEAASALPLTGTDTAVWSGQTIDATAVLIKYTYDGDANLDGKINVDDYGQIDFNISAPSVVYSYFIGDFNLDGKLNVDDYGVIDFNVSAQSTVL